MLKKKIFDYKYGQPLGYLLNKINPSEYKTLATENDANKWAKKYYTNWSTNYDKTFKNDKAGQYMTYSYSKDPIRYYCGYTANNLNRLLRGTNQNYPQDDNKSLYLLSDLLVNILFGAPRIPENLILYRYVPDFVITNILHDNKSENYSIDDGFLSCSLLLNKSIKSDFESANDILKIYVDKNSIGVYTNLLKSNNKREYEIILLKNSRMYLLDYPYKDEITGKNIYEVHILQ